MLISFLLFTKLFYPHQLKSVQNSINKNLGNNLVYRDKVLLNVVWFCILVIFLLLNVVPAVLIANVCSKGNILNLIVSFLFSDIYIFNYAIRKYVFEDNYCNV